MKIVRGFAVLFILVTILCVSVSIAYAAPKEIPACVKGLTSKKVEMEVYGRGLNPLKYKIILDFSEMPNKFSWYKNYDRNQTETLDFDYALNFKSDYGLVDVVGSSKPNHSIVNLCGVEKHECLREINYSSELVEKLKDRLVDGPSRERNVSALSCALVVFSRFEVAIAEAVARETEKRAARPSAVSPKEPGTN